MEKIPNVFLAIPDYLCFGCSPSNKHGLRLEFYAMDDGTCFTEVNPGNIFSGFPGMCHGGIASTVLDELAFWTVFNEYRRFGVTGRLALKYKRPTPVNQPLIASAKVVAKRGRLVTVESSLRLKSGEIETVSGEVVYCIVDRDGWESVTGTSVHPSISQYFD